jgi:hypothetical protein
MRYRLVFDKRYKVSGRYPVNIKGKLVLFQDGVAYVSSKETADNAKKLRFIASVEEIPAEVPVVVETVLPVAEEAPEVVVEEEAVAEEPEEEPEEAVVAHVNVVADVEETEDGVLTAQEIQDLYDSLGTWSAVANHLKITTTTLRKYREETGLL